MHLADIVPAASTLTSIDSADLELPDTARRGEAEPSGRASPRPRRAGFRACSICSAPRWPSRVKEVRESKRLTDSPCCLVNAEGGMSTQMQRLLKMANKDFPETARILEINPSAPADPPALPA